MPATSVDEIFATKMHYKGDAEIVEIVDIIEVGDSQTVWDSSQITSIKKIGDLSRNELATEKSFDVMSTGSHASVQTETICDSLQTTLRQENHCMGEDYLVSQKSIPSDVCERVSANERTLQEVNIQGRRIVDMTFVLKQLREQCSNHNSSEECSFTSLKLRKYVDRGLRTQMFFEGDTCHYVTSIWTDRDSTSVIGVNEGAVCGTISSGTTISHVGRITCNYGNSLYVPSYV